MIAYLLRRVLLIIPTLFGIMLVSFAIVQFAPGGPVERMIAQLTNAQSGATDRISGGSGDMAAQAQSHGRRIRAIAARRASIPSSSRASSGNMASTSPPPSGSG